MSDPADVLADLLAGRLPPGVHRWSSEADESEVAAAAARAGWACAVVDGARASSKYRFLAAVGRALRFPGTYGQNLDALADLLDDVPGPTVLVWEEWGALAAAEPGTFAALVDLFSERAADPRRPGFVVLLHGRGPDDTDSPERRPDA